MSSEGQTITGTVRIGAPDGFGTVFLAPRRVCGRSPTGIPSARAYLHEAAPIVAREDLKKHPFIGFVEDLLFAPQLDYSDLIGADVEPPIRSTNVLTQLHATLSGSGLCMLPAFVASGYPALAPVLPEQVSLTRSFHMRTFTKIIGAPRMSGRLPLSS